MMNPHRFEVFDHSMRSSRCIGVFYDPLIALARTNWRRQRIYIRQFYDRMLRQRVTQIIGVTGGVK